MRAASREVYNCVFSFHLCSRTSVVRKLSRRVYAHTEQTAPKTTRKLFTLAGSDANCEQRERLKRVYVYTQRGYNSEKSTIQAFIFWRREMRRKSKGVSFCFWATCGIVCRRWRYCSSSSSDEGARETNSHTKDSLALHIVWRVCVHTLVSGWVCIRPCNAGHNGSEALSALPLALCLSSFSLSLSWLARAGRGPAYNVLWPRSAVEV